MTQKIKDTIIGTAVVCIACDSTGKRGVVGGVAAILMGYCISFFVAGEDHG